MDTRSKYRTKQRDILLSYLRSVGGGHITANDVCSYFKEQGAPIGQSTVYRQLESLVDEGLVNKYIIDTNSPACFEYVDHDMCQRDGICFHCKCEGCGKLIHLKCDELSDIMGHLNEEHHFTLDPKRTVLYGLCEDCRK
ncbi:MAG: transcriptional repressor [Lachnospiraceae bacterium]|nr:transcriptional repressor [Lachnospiraceae bacterium]